MSSGKSTAQKIETRPDNCDSDSTVHANGIHEKKIEIVDGYTIKYHANGKTRWSKGRIVDSKTDGYWEWYRPDGTLKRSGYFDKGKAVGKWTTYDKYGKVYKVTEKD